MVEIDEQLIKAAKSGDAEAQYELALTYAYGDENPTKSDKKKGYKWAKKSAKQGNAKAMTTCATLASQLSLIEWIGDIKFMKWLRKAAEAGDAKSQLDLGSLVVYKGEKKADYWFKLALQGFLKRAENNDGEALFHLGTMYEYGYGVEKNYETALSYYRKSLAAGYSIQDYIDELLKKMEEEKTDGEAKPTDGANGTEEVTEGKNLEEENNSSEE